MVAVAGCCGDDDAAAVAVVVAVIIGSFIVDAILIVFKLFKTNF
jgi:hypothetical protein